VSFTVRPCADRLGSPAALLLAAIGCVLVLALTGCSRSSGASGALAPEPSTSAGPPAGSTYTLMQMNLCLSGLASCYSKAAYPAVVEEAVGRIRNALPDAVTFNEACRSDVGLIARRTGYHLRFSGVIYLGERLGCVQPGGRGLFGNAVLTKAAIESTEGQDFEAQAGIELRRWLCVTTRVDVDVCTAHLNTRTTIEVAGNDAQCAELTALLARRAAARTVIFGGDVNRRPSCAPDGFWTRTDRSAGQAPGLQHVYGSGALRSPSAEVDPVTHSDHDLLLVRAHLTAQRRRSACRKATLQTSARSTFHAIRDVGTVLPWTRESARS
jgi:endonuclease/exonuclease/phosphatase family metal-dependent hydrolase